MTTDPFSTQSGSQRHPRADGQRTRDTILRVAASLATVDGLEGLSIGTLADAIGMSKSGLYAHFGTKQGLQLATVAEAEQIFDAEVVQPALAARPGRAQLAAVCEAFFSYVERRVFAGGCFFATTALEMGARPGPVKEAIAAIYLDFAAQLRSFAETAVAQLELPADEDPEQLAFELHSILLGADAKYVLHEDTAVLDLARHVVRRRLGLDEGHNAKRRGASARQTL
jgi:AcrR family transcriptional regulator